MHFVPCNSVSYTHLFKGIVLVFTLQLFPLVFLYVAGTMKSIDNSLLEAAESMGVFGFKRMITVILPLLVPTLLAAALLRCV